jgi:streptogramin lyase
VSGMAITTPRQFRRWYWWLPVSIAVTAGLGALVWLLSFLSAPGFIDYPMLVKTDIPTAVDVAPDGAVWFTVEFSDAIGVFRNGKIDRIRKGSQNLEPLGLAADGAGGAWYTDTPMRAIARISRDGGIRSFLLSTPIVG